jgi:hypothetical protein
VIKALVAAVAPYEPSISVDGIALSNKYPCPTSQPAGRNEAQLPDNLGTIG